LLRVWAYPVSVGDLGARRGGLLVRQILHVDVVRLLVVSRRDPVDHKREEEFW